MSNAAAAMPRAGERSNLYSSLFENIPLAAARFRQIRSAGELLDLEYAEVNPAFEALTGLVDVIGKRLSNSADPATNSWPDLLAGFRHVANSGKPLKADRVAFFGETGFGEKCFAITILPAGADDLMVLLKDTADSATSDHALQQSEERFRQVAEDSGVFVWEIDPDGLYTYASPSARSVLGYEPEELVGRFHYYDLFPEDKREAQRAQEQSMMDRREPLRVFEHSKVTKDGRIVILQTNGVPLFDEYGRFLGYRGSNHDMTEERRVARQVIESEARFQQVAEMARACVWDTDDTGLCTWVSDSVRQVLGYEPSEIVGTLHFYDAVPQRHLLQQNAVLENDAVLEKVARREPFNFPDVPRLTKDGRIVSLEMIGKPRFDDKGRYLGYRGTTRDISEQKLTELLLRESEERFRQVVEGASIAIFVESDGIFRYVNPGTVRLFGARNADELLDTPTRDRIMPEFLPAVQETIEMTMAGLPVKSLEVGCLRMDATEFYVSGTTCPITFGGQKASVVFLEDITSRKTAEREHSKLQEQFYQAQKMESVGRLAGGVAHDFNNLLTVINGYTALLLTEVDQQDPLHDDMKQIHEAGEKAAALTQQLLAFSRKQVLQLQLVNITEIVRETEKILRRLIGEDIKLTSRLSPDPGLVEADRSQIGQVLMNLAVNARDAMPDGGTLSIETTACDIRAGREAESLGIPPGRYVGLTVTDSGFGMNPETAKLIFEPFFTTKEQGKGTGLGLSTVYGIVKQSKGAIEVHSNPGEGTTFRILLPEAGGLASDSKETETSARVNAGAKDAAPQTILVVEDDTNVRKLFVKVLQGAGYRVIEAADGEEALAASANTHGRIDLVLTDVRLPRLSGPQTVEKLRPRHPGLKIIFASGYTHDSQAVSAIPADSHWLAKPCSPEQLLARVRELLSDQSSTVA